MKVNSYAASTMGQDRFDYTTEINSNCGANDNRNSNYNTNCDSLIDDTCLSESDFHEIQKMHEEMMAALRGDGQRMTIEQEEEEEETKECLVSADDEEHFSNFQLVSDYESDCFLYDYDRDEKDVSSHYNVQLAAFLTPNAISPEVCNCYGDSVNESPVLRPRNLLADADGDRALPNVAVFAAEEVSHVGLKRTNADSVNDDDAIQIREMKLRKTNFEKSDESSATALGQSIRTQFLHNGGQYLETDGNGNESTWKIVPNHSTFNTPSTLITTSKSVSTLVRKEIDGEHELRNIPTNDRVHSKENDGQESNGYIERPIQTTKYPSVEAINVPRDQVTTSQSDQRQNIDRCTRAGQFGNDLTSPAVYSDTNDSSNGSGQSNDLKDGHYKGQTRSNGVIAPTENTLNHNCQTSITLRPSDNDNECPKTTSQPSVNANEDQSEEMAQDQEEEEEEEEKEEAPRVPAGKTR